LVRLLLLLLLLLLLVIAFVLLGLRKRFVREQVNVVFVNVIAKIVLVLERFLHIFRAAKATIQNARLFATHAIIMHLAQIHIGFVEKHVVASTIHHK
jgi:hypothetical protein